MENHRLEVLQTKALSLLSEREKTMGLMIVHLATDTLPSKARVFKFFAATKDAPNKPRYEIVLDEAGDAVDLAALWKSEGVELFKPQDWSVDRTRLWRFGEAEAPFTIDPPENNLVLKLGDSMQEVITVSIPKNTPDTKFDVYFLADTTGSMEPVLTAVKGASGAIVTALQGMGLDVAFGVGNYKDFTDDDIPFQHQLSPTTTPAAVGSAISAWNASGGGTDAPEAQLFALNRIATNENGIIGWRADAKRVLVWIGDAPGHEPICGALSGLPRDITVASLIGPLTSQSIVVIAISTTTDFGGLGLDVDPRPLRRGNLGRYAVCGDPERATSMQATTLANATAGIHLHEISPTNIVSTIMSAVANVVVGIDQVKLQPTGAAAIFLSGLSQGQVGPLSADGLTVTFNIGFQGVEPCTREAQVFEGAINVVVNNEIKATKVLRVTVPPCKLIEIQGSPSAAVERIIGPNDSRISVFARGSENQLRRCSNDGDPQQEASWSWEDLGRPGRSRVGDSPFAIAAVKPVFSPSVDNIYAFVKADDGHLYDISWNGLQFSNWVDHGQPGGTRA